MASGKETKLLDYGEYSQNLDNVSANLTDDIVKLGYPQGLDDHRFWDDCKGIIHKRPDGLFECSKEERTELDNLIQDCKERLHIEKRCHRKGGTFYNTGRYPAPQRNEPTPQVNQNRPSLLPSRKARVKRPTPESPEIETECWCDCCKLTSTV